MPTYVGSSSVTSGSGTATASSLTVPIPAGAQAGNEAVLVAQSLKPTTGLVSVPTGWTCPNSVGDVNGGNSVAWLFYKQLDASDISAGSVTINFNVASQCLAEMEVYSGVTGTGVLTATNIDTASNTNEPVPSIANVPAGALVAVAFAYRSASSVPDVGLLAGYTQGGRVVAGDASPFMSIEYQFKIVGAAGTYGGETGASSAAATGVGYTIAIPSNAAASTLNNAKVGAVTLAKAYVGANPVSKMYVGSTQIFP